MHQEKFFARVKQELQITVRSNVTVRFLISLFTNILRFSKRAEVKENWLRQCPCSELIEVFLIFLYREAHSNFCTWRMYSIADAQFVPRGARKLSEKRTPKKNIKRETQYTSKLITYKNIRLLNYR